MSQENELNTLKKIASDIWWLVLLRGILVVIIGLLLIFRTAETVAALVWLMGIYWFIDGIFTVIEAIRGRKSQEKWGWALFAGIISILAGFVVFTRPMIAAVTGAIFVVYLISFMIIFSGAGSIANGIRLRKKISNEWSLILGGVLYVLFGFLLLINPMMSALIITYTFGFIALIGGTVLIILSFRLRKAIK